MTTQPPDFVTFRTPQAVEVRDERVPVYRIALVLARCLYTVIELIEGVERMHLRYTLDKRSTAIPMLIARGLATHEMVKRRDLYFIALNYAIECQAVLDVVGQRGTLEDEALAEAIAKTRELREMLAPLILPPRKEY